MPCLFFVYISKYLLHIFYFILLFHLIPLHHYGPVACRYALFIREEPVLTEVVADTTI